MTGSSSSARWRAAPELCKILLSGSGPERRGFDPASLSQTDCAAAGSAHETELAAECRNPALPIVRKCSVPCSLMVALPPIRPASALVSFLRFLSVIFAMV